MSQEDKKLIIQSLKETVVPYLRSIGFMGTFPNFYRLVDLHVDLLAFQFNKYGGSFLVEISYADKKRNNVYIDKDIQVSKLRVNQTKDRFRLNSKTSDQDAWLDYSNKYLDVASYIIKLINTEAIDWWKLKYKLDN